MMKNSIKIPSVQFGDKYSALNRNSEEVFSAITEKTSDLGFSCYLKEKSSAISKTDGNYKRCEDIVKVTITVKGKNIVKTINGYYSSLEMKILLSENDIFNFLASCTKKEKIVQVVWNDVISNVGSKIVSRNIERQSLCRVIGLDENGMRRLKRLGDITVDGYIQPFIYNDELPPFFENRKTIFWKDGPDEEGFVGVWDWSAIPNKSGADSDYVESKFNKDVTPTEIIEISKAHNIDSLIDYLKQGVEEKPSCINVIFAYKVVKGGYEGVLCNNKLLEIKDDAAGEKTNDLYMDPGSKSSYNKDISFLSYDKKKIPTGGIFMREDEGFLVLDYLISLKRSDAVLTMNLVRTACEALEERYSEIKIKMHAFSPEAKKLAVNLLGKYAKESEDVVHMVKYL